LVCACISMVLIVWLFLSSSQFIFGKVYLRKKFNYNCIPTVSPAVFTFTQIFITRTMKYFQNYHISLRWKIGAINLVVYNGYMKNHTLIINHKHLFVTCIFSYFLLADLGWCKWSLLDVAHADYLCIFLRNSAKCFCIHLCMHVNIFTYSSFLNLQKLETLHNSCNGVAVSCRNIYKSWCASNVSYINAYCTQQRSIIHHLTANDLYIEHKKSCVTHCELYT